MPEQNEGTFLQKQQKIKPKIEDIINEIITDKNMKKLALDFAAFMNENKMPLRWAGFTNAWKAVCKGKCICYVRLKKNSDCIEKFWVITPYLDHIGEYEELIMNEGLQDTVFDNLFYCKRCFPEKYPEGRPCVPGRDIILLDKEIKGVCVGRQPVWAWEPDEATLNAIKRLLEFEKTARM